MNAVSNATIPKITIIIGGSFGAGNYALCGKAFDPHFIFAWPGARYAVMGAEQAAATLVSLAQRGATDAAVADLHALHEKMRAEYEHQTDIRYGAARGWVDAIISPAATRQVLIRRCGMRRVPRPPAVFGEE